MSLQLSLSTTPSARYSQPSLSSHTISPSSLPLARTSSSLTLKRRNSYTSHGDMVVVRCSSLDTVEGVAVEEGKVTEVDKDTFWPIVKGAGHKTVVVDMYTQWCGPCKVIAPKYQELSQKYLDVVFLKLDCNQENRPLATELGIKVVPTFKILKDGKIVKEVTGAKLDPLIQAIETVRSS